MIGFDYSDVYVAACGRPFSSWRSGKDHERTCRECKLEADPDYYDGKEDREHEA